ncbi:MAG: FecR domain-containing protein [Paracoccaceae bacterium]
MHIARWLVALSLVIAVPAPRAGAQEVGVVKTIEGKVRIERGEATIMPDVGTPLLRDDRVVTELRSAFGATLHDGTTLSLGGRSSIEIARFVFEPDEGIFALLVRVLTGQMIYRAGRIGAARPDRVEIETPRLSVGTRGTRFAVVVPPDP